MPTPTPPDINTPATRFRSIALLAATVALIGFGWTIGMLLHFNAGPSGVQFGSGTMLNIASIALPGPVLLLFLACQARHRFCRIAGWAALLPVLAVGLLPAINATIKLRPVAAPGSYDAAAREAELRANTMLSGPIHAAMQLTHLRAEFAAHPTTKDDYAALLISISAVRRQFEDHARAHAAEGGLRAAMAAPFDDRAISPARRDEYLRLAFAYVSPELATKSVQQTITNIRGFESRLKLLADNWGKWRWENAKAIRFDDGALQKAFDALPDVEAAP